MTPASAVRSSQPVFALQWSRLASVNASAAFEAPALRQRVLLGRQVRESSTIVPAKECQNNRVKSSKYQLTLQF